LHVLEERERNFFHDNATAAAVFVAAVTTAVAAASHIL